MRFDRLEVIFCEGVAGAVPTIRAQVEARGFEGDVGAFEDGAQDFEAFGHDLLTDAVARDHCKLESRHDSNCLPVPRQRKESVHGLVCVCLQG